MRSDVVPLFVAICTAMHAFLYFCLFASIHLKCYLVAAALLCMQQTINTSTLFWNCGLHDV